MEEKLPIERLPEALLPWYRKHRRELPWRKDKDPYHIWVSEIMLQQTRVEAVKGYYARFLDTLPTISAVAACDDEVLQKLWEGLGYYSRVRNLKKAAKQVVEDYGGVFPREYDRVMALPGIGEYTAGAICSIAYDLPVPAVDGNVLRVISRITDDSTPVDLPAFKKKVFRSLRQIYPAQAGDFTQALMELGATVCGPNRQPACEDCPCRDFCLGYRHGTAARLPVKLPKRQRKTEERTVFILFCDDRVAIEKRSEKGLLAGLWQFPNVIGKLDMQEAVSRVEKMGLKPVQILRQVEKKHIFTHIEWDMCGIYIRVADTDEKFTWVTAGDLVDRAALPTAFRMFWEDRDAADGDVFFQKNLKKYENSI